MNGTPVTTPIGAPLVGMFPMIVGVALPVGVPYTTVALGLAGLSTITLWSPNPSRSPKALNPLSITLPIPVTPVLTTSGSKSYKLPVPVVGVGVGVGVAVGALAGFKNALYSAIAFTGSKFIALIISSGDICPDCITSNTSLAVASGLASNQSRMSSSIVRLARAASSAFLLSSRSLSASACCAAITASYCWRASVGLTPKYEAACSGLIPSSLILRTASSGVSPGVSK